MLNKIKSMLENKVRTIKAYDVDRYGINDVPPRYKGKEIIVFERDYEDECSPIWEVTYYAASRNEGSISFRTRFSRNGEFIYDYPEQIEEDIEVEILL